MKYKLAWKSFLSIWLVLVLSFFGVAHVNAETGDYYKVSLTNAEAAAYEGTLYTLVNGSYEVVTVTTADTGTAYIGNDGNTYTADAVSSQWTDSAGNAWGCVNYSTSATYDYYVTSSLKTFTRSKSGIYYRYTLDGGSTTSTNKTSASDARSAFVTWVSSTYGSSYVADCRNNGDNYYAAAYIPIVSTSTVTAYTYSYSSGSVTSTGASGTADIELYVYGTGAGTTVNSGTFKVASLNVDGLPSSLSLAGGAYNLSMNSDGPGSDGTKLISQYVASSGIDLYSVQEDFDYNDELLSAISGIYTSGTFRGTLTSLASNISVLQYYYYLNGSKHIDTDGLNILALSATTSLSNESIVAWNTTYGTTSNGNDQLVDKGYRFYNATINGVTLDVYILHMDAEVDDEDIAARESQMTQLANAIISSNTSNPILVIGDTNCRYTRDRLETLFMDVINAQENLTASDAWVELEYDGVYPEYGTSSLMASELGYQKGEIVDKVIYINNSNSEYTLQAVSYTVDTTGYVDSDGTALGDHYPVIVEFSYTNADEETHVHTAGEAVTEKVVAATCTTDGSYDSVIYCTECGEELSRETITVSATGHTAGEAVTENEVAAMCTTEGSYDTVVYCTVCGEELSRETTTVAATGHTWDDGVVTAEPTETETGVKTYTCTICGETYTEEIPATGHTHVYSSEVTKEATCTEEGIITYTCSCGDTYTETIAKLTCKAYELGVTDIDHTAWYHEAVNYALTEGFMTVYSDGTFGVNTTVTRAMLAEMLYKKEGSSSVTVASNPFTDVSSDAWYYNSVMWANVNGIVTGYTGTTEFRPTNAVTRQEAAIMIVRYLIYKGELTSADLESVDTSVLDSYSDAGSISSWAEKYVALAVSEGIIHGYDNANELRPLNNITRAEMAQIIYNIFG